MGVLEGPGIVTKNLVFCGDPIAYSGSGTNITIPDLTGNGYDATTDQVNASNGDISDGWIDFGNSAHYKYISIPDGAIDTCSATHTSTGWTLEMWLYCDNITSAINTFLSCGPGNDGLYYAASTGTTVYSNPHLSAGFGYSIPLQTPYMFSATGLNGVMQTYKNGVAQGSLSGASGGTHINSSSTIGTIIGQEMDAVAGGFDPSQSWLGKVGAIRFYNRALSPPEMIQNFDSQKSRYS